MELPTVQIDNYEQIVPAAEPFNEGEPEVQGVQEEDDAAFKLEDLYYDNMIVVKSDYLLLTCCILALPSLFMA